MKFSGKIAHATKKNLEHFWVVVINPLNSGSIFLFCKSVIVSTIKEKRMNGFSLIFHDISGTTQKIDRLFHAWLDCFMVSHLGAGVCLLVISWTNRRIDFHEISRMYRLWHKEPPRKFVVVMRWTPWKQGLFSGSVVFLFFCNIRNQRLDEYSEYELKRKWLIDSRQAILFRGLKLCLRSLRG